MDELIEAIALALDGVKDATAAANKRGDEGALKRQLMLCASELISAKRMAMIAKGKEMGERAS